MMDQWVAYSWYDCQAAIFVEHNADGRASLDQENAFDLIALGHRSTGSHYAFHPPVIVVVGIINDGPVRSLNADQAMTSVVGESSQGGVTRQISGSVVPVFRIRRRMPLHQPVGM